MVRISETRSHMPLAPAMTEPVIRTPKAKTVFRDSGITVELTRRREFIQASPDQLSYETRPGRSRPTICFAPSRLDELIFRKTCIALANFVGFVISKPKKNA